MKLNTKELKQAMVRLSCIVPSRSSLTALTHVIVHPDGHIIADSLDTRAAIKLGHEPTGCLTESVCVNFRDLKKTIASIDSNKVEFRNCMGPFAEMLFDGGSVKFTAIDVSEFPTMSGVEYDNRHEMLFSYFYPFIAKTFKFASNDFTRQNMNGVCLERSANKLTAISTDGHRMQTYADDHIGFFLNNSTSEDNNNFSSILINHETCKLIAGFKKVDKDSMIEIRVNEVMKRIKFKFENVWIESRLIDSKFPEWRRVMPNCLDMHETVVNKKQLLAALKSVKPMTGKSRGIKLEFNGSINIQSSNADAGTSIQKVDYIESDYSNHKEALEIGFNVEFLIAAISEIESDMLKLYTSDQLRPCLIKENKPSSNVDGLVMPMRI